MLSVAPVSLLLVNNEFEILFRNFHGGTEEYQSGYLVYGSRFELGTPITRNGIDIHSTARF
jgi:hypothetical protein